MTWDFVEPITNEMSIEEFEADYNVTLPADYKDLARQYNNGYPSDNVFTLPDGEMCRVDHLYSFNRDDPENMWDFNSSANLEAGLVAFATDSFGNQLAFRMVDNAVVFADYDTDEILEIATDFQTFLGQLRYVEADA